MFFTKPFSLDILGKNSGEFWPLWMSKYLIMLDYSSPWSSWKTFMYESKLTAVWEDKWNPPRFKLVGLNI